MKLMVLDGNSILNRSYYGIRPLTTKDGFYTQAIYGFLVTMARLEDEERPDAVCVTFDRREPTFRHLEYEGYKAQRKGMPEELAMQLPVMKEVLDAMNIPRYELAGYEADDLIGTISRKCEAAGWTAWQRRVTRIRFSSSRSTRPSSSSPPAWGRPPRSA